MIVVNVGWCTGSSREMERSNHNLEVAGLNSPGYCAFSVSSSIKLPFHLEIMCCFEASGRIPNFNL